MNEESSNGSKIRFLMHPKSHSRPIIMNKFLVKEKGSIQYDSPPHILKGDKSTIHDFALIVTFPAFS